MIVVRWRSQRWGNIVRYTSVCWDSISLADDCFVTGSRPTTHTHQRSRDCVGTLRLRGSWSLFFSSPPLYSLCPPLSLDFSRFKRRAELPNLTRDLSSFRRGCTSVSAVVFSPHAVSRQDLGFFCFPRAVAKYLHPNLGSLAPDIGISLLCGWLLGPGQT